MKPSLATLLLALSPLAAQAAGPTTPDAGSILQELKPATPPPPSSSGTGLTIEREGVAKTPPGAPFPVKTFRVVGNQTFDAATLRALVADGENKTLTLEELQKLAARITDYYHDRGHPLARALIPAQKIEDGVVAIEVIEAHYGKIRLDNRSPVNTPLLEATLSPLHSGDVITQAEMDHALLLLSDIPGIQVNATLQPGERVGTADLLVNSTSGPSTSGAVTLDNYGNRYTGRTRIGGTINFIDPLHQGDVLSLAGLSTGGDLNYGRIGYEFLLNGKGTRLGGSYTALRYTLGGSLSSLNGNGTAQVASAWATHPLIRHTNANLYGRIQYDRLQLRDHVDSTALRTDRTLENGTISLAGDARDALLAGGITTWSTGWTAGHVGFDDTAAQLADATTARTQGSFSKWNASLTRVQGLSPRNTLVLIFSGQWANDNLDSSQKIIAGGPYTVRAYDIGALSGDSGYLGTAEFRHDLGRLWGGQWQAIGFVDGARITVNHTSFATGENHATLSGAGIGLNWLGANGWGARVYVATRLGSPSVLVGHTASTRGWVELAWHF